MRPLRVLRPLHVLLLTSVLSPGCAAWREVYRTPPTQYIAEHRPKRVRVTLEDSSAVLLRPTASADSISGVAEGPAGATVGVPASRVRGLAVRGPATWPMWTACGLSVAYLVTALVLLSGPRAVRL